MSKIRDTKGAGGSDSIQYSEEPIIVTSNHVLLMLVKRVITMTMFVFRLQGYFSESNRTGDLARLR